MAKVEVLTAELDGKTITYTNVTEFRVETTRTPNPKSGYETRNRVVGNFGKAVLLYRCYNIGNGYKKRLVMEEGEKDRVLARASS